MRGNIAKYDVIDSNSTKDIPKNKVTASHFLYTKELSASHLGNILLI